MPKLPDFLTQFDAKAKKYLKEGRVEAIEFSGSTYQVKVLDATTNEPVWAFLQLDNRGKIKDSFCSCEEGEDIHHCVHQAAALLAIYNSHGSPLHHRFERSFWNLLCREFSKAEGGDLNFVKKRAAGSYSFRKNQFAITGKNKEAREKLESIFQERTKETEETSLKFSNLSQEEIAQWKAGKPSVQLAYELSFWNDIAKWLMTLQDEGKPYKLSFTSKKLPNHLLVSFAEVECSFALTEEILLAVIPALETVESPLKLHQTALEDIEKIEYIPAQGCFLVSRKKGVSPQVNASRKKGIPIGDWTYVPDEGFYSGQSDLLLSSEQICGAKLEQLLNSHLPLMQELLKEVSLHIDPIQMHYTLRFDPDWNLHIEPFLFNPGDLKTGDTKQFGNWIYLDGEKGFYRLENPSKEYFEKIVPIEEVAAFVSQNRTWLNAQEGFQTHLSPIEAVTTYHVDIDGRLSFSRRLNLYASDEAETKDFGRWVYIKGHGFFSKVSTQTQLPMQIGVVLTPSQIPVFIKSNRRELQLVPNFFSEQCPVVKSGLNITLEGEGERILVTPVYVFAEEFQDKEVRIFDDFAYVEGGGFYELPPELRLPERYRHLVEIEEDKFEWFFSFEVPIIRPFISTIDPRLEKPEYFHLLASDVGQEPSGLYHLTLYYKTEKGEIPATLFWTDYQKKKKYLFTSAGAVSLGERRFQWIKQLAKDKVDNKSNVFFLSALELLRLNAFEEIEVKKGTAEETERSRRLIKELTEFRLPEEPNLAGLKSVLRPYQHIGVRWLWFLHQHQLSGLLCDDMGLGKTHQTMALFQAIYNANRGKEQKTHFLVVCPTSVIYHWQEKLHQFIPELKVWTFYGANRKLETFYQECDILLTSYGVWRNECAKLDQLQFEVAVFDEIQIAKNYQSRIHAALLKAKARMRLGLTGTPIENRLRELKSLFDIVLPTYMPSENDYKDHFINPIEKEGDESRKQLLSRLIKPFVLRRKKESVLDDLPEKTEEIAHCDLADGQRQLYVEVLTRSRDKIISELMDDANPVPYIHIFALLSHLKQVCDHPAVFLKKPAQYKEYRSGKWELFVELLNEARESQQKVVVFTQYLMMMDIFEHHLKESHIGYASIRGSTMNRSEQLIKFNQDPNCEVFLGSLQAAGLGIDLTAASVVIHYDRWWNAARENQATDRVHRIGQKRGVQVFKLVTKDTLEEHIDTLIAKKGKLMEEVLGIDDHQLLKKFDRKEMIQLLQMMPQ